MKNLTNFRKKVETNWCGSLPVISSTVASEVQK